MYFTACDRNDGYGRCDIYYSFHDGTRWSPGANVGTPGELAPTGNHSPPSAPTAGCCSLSVTGRADREEWISGTLSAAVTANGASRSIPGKTINTAGDEFSPFIYFNSRTLYFSSNGKRDIRRT
ncbi:MAG: hypothetical protein MZV63_08390 [Marinilabiliales bacterium]|nr:hypothetical protein [Marinilabiliales bacterium]